MLKLYIKTAWRNLLRNKLFSGLNVLGLAIGMAGAILIAIWLQNMLSYDRFHKDEDQLYVVSNLDRFSGDLHAWNWTPKILGPELKNVTPEITEMSRFDKGHNFLFTKGEKRIVGEDGSFVDPDFFKMFNFSLLKGGINKDWESGKGVVMTAEFARSVFGDEDPLGKTVKLDSSDYVTVTGVLANFPSNTMFKSPFFLSWDYARHINQFDSGWDSNSVNTFIKLAGGTDITGFNNKIREFTHEHNNGVNSQLFVTPLKEMFLYNEEINGEFVTGRIVLVRCFFVIGILLVIIACINFMNLSTAQSEKRAKEVGVKKVIGATRRRIILQFLTESILVTFIAFVLALVIVVSVLPAFNTLVETDLHFSFGWAAWLFAFIFVLMTGILAGSYPAFYLSSFKPVVVLKGTFKRVASKVSARSVLVVVQFTVAIILILTTIMITSDTLYVQDRDKGYAQNGLAFTMMTGQLSKNYLPLKNELLASGAVTSVCKNWSPITQRYTDSWGMKWPGSTKADEKVDFIRFSSDADMVKTMKMQLVDGRDIDIYKYPADSTAMVLTESAVKVMNLKSPIGTIVRDVVGNKWHVVGVVKDFIIEQPTDKIAPMLIQGANAFFSTIHYRLNPDRPITDNMATVQNIFTKFNPEFPFEFSFADAAYAEKFKETKKVAQLSFLFAGLTIFISCLGLFGLITYLAEGKKKEIGIRKVLGASIAGIIGMLSKGFLYLIIISFVIAIPIAYYVMKKWLGSSDYSVGISWWWFAVTILGTLIISFVTVSFQALKAARMNPVSSLKSE